MKIQLQLFAAARETLGRSELLCELPSPATVRQLRERLGAAHPQLAELLERTRFARGVDYVSDDVQLTDGEQLALIPPVSGG